MVAGLALAQNDTWAPKEDYPGGGRIIGTSFSIGSKIYAGLGLDGTTFQPVDDFYEYDIANDTWTPLGNFDGGARGAVTGISINGKGYVMFGTNNVVGFKDVWEYTASTDTWLKKADFPGVARAGGFVFVVNNKAYIGAGNDQGGAPLNDLWEYDPAGDSWVQKTSLPAIGRLYPTAFSIGTNGYVGTGLDNDDDDLKDLWEYNTLTNQWTRKADLPVALSGGIGFATATRGYIGLGSTPDLYSYYPTENVWVQEASLPGQGLYVNGTCSFVGGKAYVGLGLNTAPSLALYQYIPGTEQSITFNALTAKTFGDATFGLSATASSGLTVAFTSSNTSVATISGTTVTIVGAGTTTISAKQAGNGTYDAALPVDRTLTVNKANQTITFNALTGKNVNDASFGLTATASSSLSVSYVSSNTAVATISGTTVTIVGVGTTTITASQAGNGNYNAAASVDRDLVVSKLAQTITFAAIATKSPLDPPFSLTATASSGLALSYVSSNTAVATINGSLVTILAPGTTTITASQAGNAAYNAAPSVNRDLVVSKPSQSWTGALPTTAGYGSDIPLAIQLSSGLPYTVTSSNQNIATAIPNGLGWIIRPTGVGTTTITASHAGNANFEEAPTLTADLVISKGVQTITFTELSGIGSNTYTIVTATVASGLPVTFDTPLDLSTIVTGNIATVFGSFTGSLTARQAGNNLFEPVQANWVKTSGKLNAPLNMEPIAEMAIGDAQFVPVVTTVSDLIVYTFSSTNTAVAQVIGGQVVIVGTGTTNIIATNPGNDYYNPSSASRQLVVKQPHTITFGELPVKTFGDAPFNVQATTNAPLPITFSSSDPGVATVEGNTVTIKGVGTTWIIASAGDATFTRRNVSRVLTVKNVVQTSTQQGQFWGVATGGGSQKSGLIFKTNSDGSALTVVKEFKGGSDDGTHPGSSVVVASNGKLYGWTGDGASNNEGALFEFDPATSAITKKFDFGFADYPLRDLVATPNGKIYGSKTMPLGSESGSIVFEFDVATGTFTKFKGVGGMISWVTDVMVSSTGKIYVTGSFGNALERRTFYEWDLATNTLIKKADVPWYSGDSTPVGATEVNGKFYGTAISGGADNEGFIFEFDPVAGTATQKIDFVKISSYRISPQGLMRASNGKIYGTTGWGGINQTGNVFEYDPVQNVMTSLAAFPGFLGNPRARMMEATNGKLYGTSDAGGSGGTLFEFNPATNVLTPVVMLNDNTGKSSPGSLGLLNNKLYGFTYRGGAYNAGTVFEFDYAGRSIVKKYDFVSAIEGHNPHVGLTPMSNNKLYGVNRYGGAYDDGTIFEYDPATDVYKKLYDFNAATVGNNPQTPLLAGLNGKLYGSTRSGTNGNIGSGSIFEFDPATGVYKTLLPFRFYETGVSINHRLIQSQTTGKLYGLNPGGGTNTSGVLFELDPATKVFKKLHNFSSATGGNPMTAPIIASNERSMVQHRAVV